MRLTFKREDVLRLIAHSEEHPEMRPFFGETFEAPVLYLVGDEGVYLISGSTVVLPGTNTASFVAYATECHPKLPFDTWWTVKRESFGPDDGAEPVPCCLLKRVLDGGDGDLLLDITPGKNGAGGTWGWQAGGKST